MRRALVAALVGLLVTTIAATPAITKTLWTVAISAVDRAGQPVVNGVTAYSVWDLSTGEQVAFGHLTPDSATRVPTGRYSVETVPIGADGSRTLVLLPEVRVSGDTAVVLDARAGRAVSVSLDDHRAEQIMAAVFVYQRARNGRVMVHGMAADRDAEGLFVIPIARRADITMYVFTVWNRSADLDVYNLVDEEYGRVPDRPAYHHRTAELAKVHVDYKAQAVAACGRVFIEPELAGERGLLAHGQRFPLPARRTEYYTPSDRVGWFTDFVQTDADCSFDDADGVSAAPIRYKRRGEYTMGFNTAPIAPASRADIEGQPTAFRQGDALSFLLPMYTDAEVGHIDGGGPYAGVTGSATLSHDGQRICSSETVEPLVDCPVPHGPGRYELSVAAERAVPWSKLSTRTDTTWTFRSAAAPRDEPVAQRLLNVRYDILLDAYNSAPAGGPFTFAVHVDGAQTIDLAASYDEGAIWQRVRLLGSGGNRVAQLDHPSRGSVSLRVTATDAAGDSVTQTLIRAYLLRHAVG